MLVERGRAAVQVDQDVGGAVRAAEGAEPHPVALAVLVQRVVGPALAQVEARHGLVQKAAAANVPRSSPACMNGVGVRPCAST